MVLGRSEADEQWCARLRGPVAEGLLGLDLPGVAVNVRDDVVRHSLMTLTTLNPPVLGFVSLRTQQCYGDQVSAALALLREEAEQVAAYLVSESVPLPPPASEPGERTTGLANVALPRRPAGLDEEAWLSRWQRDHTSVAIRTQATFGYTQNWVVRALTPDAPTVSGIVEELFEAITELHAFFGASDDADLQDRLSRMIASTAAFGSNVNVETVPTSRYVFRTPFAA